MLLKRERDRERERLKMRLERERERGKEIKSVSERKRAVYIVGCRGASQLGGSLLGIPLGFKANKL